ncbi:MAG: hypothetical protein QOI45_2669, partial [Thermoleophilaceae bacterium]|nr:hypothetical protein [Thermoleophilaceae bacterium]
MAAWRKNYSRVRGRRPARVGAMATEQDTSKPDATLRPQTAAARRRSPEEARHRDAAERERLREESRARRHARENGEVLAPEPQDGEISVRRLPERLEPPPARAPTAPPPASAPTAPPPASAPTAPPPASPLRPSTPAGGARQAGAAPAAPAAPPAPPSSPPSQRPAPARRPSSRPPLTLPRSPRERASALLGLASAVGVVVCLAASIGSGNLPGFGGADMRAGASARAVAPGGWITVNGHDAPGNATLVLESRSKRGGWHAFAE